MKFLVDAMLGKLARFLRIFGYDTVYANDLITYYNLNPVPDDLLLQYANENKRIIITKDLPFFSRVKKNVVLLEGKGIYNYLQQLNTTINLQFKFDIKKGRCSICNDPLRRVIKKDSIKKLVPPETFKVYSEFYQCSNPRCNQVFWEGPHIIDIIKKVSKYVKDV